MAELITIKDPISPNEAIWYTPDFGRALRPGATISSPSFNISVLSGSDASAGSRLTTGVFGGITSPSIVPSQLTGLANQAVSQRVAGCVSGVSYKIGVTVITSDGEILEAALILRCASI